MAKPVDMMKSTAHAQAAEFAAVAAVTTQPADTTALKSALRDALAAQATLTDELAAEKEAHAKTQAALDAATASPVEEPAA